MLNSFQRLFSGPYERLLDVFFQIVLQEYNAYEFSEQDWKEFALAYGKLFYTFESLWIEQMKPFEEKNKNQLSFEVKKINPDAVNESFKASYQSASKYLSEVPFELDQAYIDYVDFNSFIPANDICEPIPSIFSGIKGSFNVIDHDPGVWAFNAIDLTPYLEQLKKQFDDLLTSYLTVDSVSFLNSFIIYGAEETLSLKQKVTGEKHALTKELAFQPNLFDLPIDRIIFLIHLKYQKIDQSPLNPESIRRAANRMKKRQE